MLAGVLLCCRSFLLAAAACQRIPRFATIGEQPIVALVAVPVSPRCLGRLLEEQPGPCGGARPTESTVTRLQAASLLNVSWHNTNPNQGSTYSLALLDSNGSLLVPYGAPAGPAAAQFWPGALAGSGRGASPLQTWQLIQLPSVPCPACTLRLVERLPAGSPGNLSHPPELWSCADVNITLGLDACSNQCQGWGTCALEPAGLGAFACQCNPLEVALTSIPGVAPTCDAVSGTYGELRDACVRDSDCGPSGQCQARTLSRPRHCFCKAGWRGPLCGLRSQLSLEPQLDLRAWEVQYPFKLRAPGVAMYFRILGPPQAQLIEVALAAATQSYVSVGWRPASIDQAAALPALLPWGANPVPESPLAPLYQNASLIFSTDSSPLPLLSTLAPVSGIPPTSLLPANTTGGPSRRRLLQTGASQLASFNRSSPVVQGHYSLPPSWLSDMTACYAKGDYFKVEDLSTGASYSTPLPDGALGGADDIVDAIGRAADGLLLCKFRRPLVSGNSMGDQAVTLHEDQTVVWAVGQTPAQAANGSGGVLDAAGLAQLYTPTDMLYHGTNNRGVFGDLNLILGRPLSAVPPNLCHPSPLPLFDCTFRINARLRLHWRVVAASLSLALEFPASVGWAALGWSPRGHMLGATTVIGTQAGPTGPVGVYQLTAKAEAGIQPSSSLQLTQAGLVRKDESTAFMSFVRPLNVGPVGASIVVGQPSRMIWALAEDGSPALHYHRLQNRGSFTLDFSTGEGTVERNPAGWYGLHAWLMATALGALLPLGVIFIRASRGAKAGGASWYFEGVHVAFQLLGAAAVAGALAIAFLTFVGGPGRAVRSLHGLVGLAVAGLLFAQLAVGWLPFLEYPPALERLFRLAHAVVGLAVLGGGNWAVLLGLHRIHTLTGIPIRPLLVGQCATLALMAALWLLAAVGLPCVRWRACARPRPPPSPRQRPWVPSPLSGPFNQQPGVPALEYGAPLRLDRNTSQRFLLDEEHSQGDLPAGLLKPRTPWYSPAPHRERSEEGHSGEMGGRRSDPRDSDGGLLRSKSFQGWVSP